MADGLNHQLIVAATEYNERVAAHIATNRSFGGQAYSTVTLENDEFGLVDFFGTDFHDSNLLISTKHTTLYWGSAGHPFDPTSKCQITLNSSSSDRARQAQEMEAAKQLILGAVACEAAIARLPPETLELGKTIAALIGRDTIHVTERIYGRAGAPIGMIKAGQIIRHNRVDDGQVSKLGALLWYPPIENPASILAAMKKYVGKLRPVHLTP